VNVDKRNYRQVPELLDALDNAGLKNQVDITITKVEPFTEKCRSILAHCFTSREFARVYVDLCRDGAKKGFDLMISPKAFTNYCTADCLDSFVIDARGNVAKCWNSVGVKSQRIGTVFSDEFNDNYVRWLSYDPFEDKRCVACKYLPVCMGGCPYSVVHSGLMEHCNDVRFRLKDVLLMKYRDKIIKEGANESKSAQGREEGCC
jgi:uncharacterized protein